MHKLTIETPRLLLRRLVGDDRDAFVQYYEASREHLRPWVPTGTPGATAEQVFYARVLRALIGAKERRYLHLVAFTRDGAVAGTFNLNNIIRGVAQSASVGWNVHAEMTGQGIGTEGVLGLLDLAFAPAPLGLGLHRVQADVIPENLPSLRLVEKAGFRREGLAREYLKIDGRWRDHINHAKLAHEHQIRYLQLPEGAP